jgi:hypothetical protein
MIDFDRRLGIARAERSYYRSGIGLVFESDDTDKCDGTHSFWKANENITRDRDSKC